VFPFAFRGSSAGWSIAVRVLLAVAIAGSAISIMVQRPCHSRAGPPATPRPADA
jgi:hypothetical protein